MSYTKAMKWAKRHPKGTRQPVLMHTDRGFTPSKSFLDEYWKYLDKCREINVTPVECEYFYHNSHDVLKQLRYGTHSNTGR